MSIIDTLITDRTQTDVDRADALAQKGFSAMTPDEQAEWLAGSKGRYKASDLNRVGEAMIYISQRLKGYGYAADVSPRTDWEMSEKPTVDEMDQYLDDLATLRALLELAPTTPGVPSDMRKLTFEEANDIERILFAVENAINHVVAAFRRSNAPSFWSGNVPLPTATSDFGRTWEELDAMETTWANWQVADWYLLLYGNLKAEGEVM